MRIATNNMPLRPYTPADCEATARVFYEAVHGSCAGDYTAEQLDAWAPAERDMTAWGASLAANHALVAVENERVVGFADTDGKGYLDRLYVHPAYQARGIATTLCDALERQWPAPVFTTHASRTARPFFEARGYRVVRAQQVERHGVTLGNFVMKKEAQPNA